MPLPYPPDRNSIIRAIRELPEKFRTNDLANHPIVQAANKGLLGEKTYSADFGKYLAENASDLGIKSATKARTNTSWRRVEELEPDYGSGEDGEAAPAEREYLMSHTYAAGEVILHKKFGRGTVRFVKEREIRVVFDNDGIERRLRHSDETRK